MYICLFDIDGTLLSSGGAGKAAMEAALAEEFGVALLDHRVPFSGRTDRAIGRDLLHFHNIDYGPENWQRFRARYLQLLPECLHRHRGKVLPGIGELLALLAGRADMALGLLTGNLREGARLKLGHYGIHEYFAFGGYGDEHFDRDEVAHAALAAARRHLNGADDRSQFWVVGDTPLDVQCARAIGARVAAVATGWHSVEELAGARPDLLLPDLSDPKPLLACWE
jgi:phosphoglycolate phosphatase